MRFTALFLFVSVCGAADPAGRWEGSAAIPGAELPLVVDLAQSDGKWSGSATIPGFNIKGAPLGDIAVDGSAVTFTIKGAFGDPKLLGHLTGDDTLAGDFTQLGNTAPFALRKTGLAQVEPLRVATPVGKELEGEWHGEFDLGGNMMRARLVLTNQAAATTVKFVVGRKKDLDLPVDFVTQEGAWLRVEAHAYGMAYEGRFRAAKNEIEGSFAQGGLEFPLVLHRGADTNAHN